MASPTAAQRRLTAIEVGVGGLAALADADFVGAALGAAYRPGGQLRVAALAAPGSLDQRAAVRLEATAQFMVTPTGRSGSSLYAGVGVAWQGARGASGAAYFSALVGLEGAPGRRLGWYMESGLGGGIRLAAGVRWRRFPAGW